MLNVLENESEESVESEDDVGTSSKYSGGRGHYYRETYCCNAIGNVVFTARTEELTFWEKKLAEWTWGRGLFCLRSIRSPGESVYKYHLIPCNAVGIEKALSGKS